MEIQKCLCVILWKAKPGAPETQVLLLQMKAERGGLWQPVTGHIDPGEDFQAAALREAEEESGLLFEREPQYLGLEYRFDGRFGPTRERAFALWVYGGEAPPPVKIDPSEHTAYLWLPPAEALKRLPFPGNQEAVKRASTPVPPLLLNKRGAWMQEGEEITHERTAELLHRSLQKTASGFFVRIGQEELEAIIEDTPRFVQSFDATSGTLGLRGADAEILNPESLEIGAENILYCKLQNGWHAKFLSGAYYAIARGIREEHASGRAQYFLHFHGRDYEILIPH